MYNINCDDTTNAYAALGFKYLNYNHMGALSGFYNAHSLTMHSHY